MRPEANITRAETAAVLFRLLSDPNKGSYLESMFSDITDDLWYAQSVKYLTSNGIIQGYPDGTFRGDSMITRAEFATLIAKFDMLEFTDDNAFPDIVSHWAFEYINSSAAKGWVIGYPNGEFRPEAYLRRAEIVTAINNMLLRAIMPEDIPDWAPNYNDIDLDHWAYANIIEASVGHEFQRKLYGYEIWIQLLSWQPVLES